MAQAFHLEVGEDHLATLTFDLPDRKANIFTREALAEFDTLLVELSGRDDIGCLVLLSAKPGMFIAGADVAEIAGVADPDHAESGSRYGHRLFSAWEQLPFPTVSAVSGTCLGGGTELSLASSFIVVSDRADLRIGLPEVKLGILPGWGGCVRLPRRVGLVAALDIILAGKAVSGKQALRMGLADALFPEAGFLHHVRDFARSKVGRRRPRRRLPGGLKRLLLEGPAGRWFMLDQATKEDRHRHPGALSGPSRGARGGADRDREGPIRRLRCRSASGPRARGLAHCQEPDSPLRPHGGREEGRPRRRRTAARGPPTGSPRRRRHGRRHRPAHGRQGGPPGARQGHPARGDLHCAAACRERSSRSRCAGAGSTRPRCGGRWDSCSRRSRRPASTAAISWSRPWSRIWR